MSKIIRTNGNMYIHRGNGLSNVVHKASLYYILRQKETGGLILSSYKFHRWNCCNGFGFTLLFGISLSIVCLGFLHSAIKVLDLTEPLYSLQISNCKTSCFVESLFYSVIIVILDQNLGEVHILNH